MGMSYFHEWTDTDASVCNNCEHFEIKDDFGTKFHCKSSGNTSTKMIKLSKTSSACSELDVREKAGLDKKSTKKGLVGKLADKAKKEAKAAVMRDVNTMGKNLKKML